MQLVTDRVTLYDPIKYRSISIAEVREKFGVAPERLVDVLALAGDASDNVPAVPSIGIKTAARLISTYGDLETLPGRAGEIVQSKVRQALAENAESARLSRRLVQLDDAVALAVPLDALAVTDAIHDDAADSGGDSGITIETPFAETDEIAVTPIAAEGPKEPPPFASPSMTCAPHSISRAMKRPARATGTTKAATDMPEIPPAPPVTATASATPASKLRSTSTSRPMARRTWASSERRPSNSRNSIGPAPRGQRELRPASRSPSVCRN
jgi:DNA polymerase-1